MQEGSDDEAEEVDSSDEEEKEDGKEEEEEEEEGEFDCINKVMCFQTFINTTICTKHED